MRKKQVTLIYLLNCKDLNDLKQTYKTFAKQLHPDKGGCIKDMQQLNAEYDFLLESFINAQETSEESKQEEKNYSEEYKEVLNKIIALEGIIIELTGSWIWVTGDTKPVKDNLKEAGFFWAKNKAAWFWRPADQKSLNRKPFSLDEIRGKYGSEAVVKDSRKALEV